MTTLRIIDSITDRGDPRRDNEDAYGGNRHCAFVIDGATGLGGDFLEMGSSDAAWLASFARDCFEDHVGRAASMSSIVRMLNGRVRALVAETRAGEPMPGWSMPVAGFQMVHVVGDEIRSVGLGDCRIFAVAADGTTYHGSALPRSHDAEREDARHAISAVKAGSASASLADDPGVRDELRRRRALYNQPGGSVWTLGAEPLAADHIVETALPIAAPLRGLLCTDGFAALVDLYGRHDAGSLVRAAAGDGLVPLLAELRRIEKREDPDRALYPRFKISDDATAVLFEVT